MDKSDNSDSGKIDLDEILLKLKKLFDFTTETALDEERYNLAARLDAAHAAAQIADAIVGILGSEFMEIMMMGPDEFGDGDPSSGPGFWSKQPVEPDNSASGKDEPISPDELDID